MSRQNTNHITLAYIFHIKYNINEGDRIMVYRGQIQNGVVVFEGNARPPEGAIVEVQPINAKSENTADDPIYHVGELAGPTGCPDLARNIDHYLYNHINTGKNGQ
jgi:hypothetical protein